MVALFLALLLSCAPARAALEQPSAVPSRPLRGLAGLGAAPALPRSAFVVRLNQAALIGAPAALLPAIAEAARAGARGGPVIAGRVAIVTDFRSAILGNSRSVAVYLPPGYGDSRNAARRYPVLYAHDGQNMFDPATSFDGAHDWGLGKTCDELIAAGRMEPVIIVAPYNTPARLDEYGPWLEPGLGGGKGDLYGRFLSDELKPAIDAAYRTEKGPQRTTLLGSSLGGLISLYLAWTRPDAFGGAAVVSPSLRWANGQALRMAASDSLPQPLPRLWLDMGAHESSSGRANKQYVEDLRRLKEVLLSRGWRLADTLRAEVIDGSEINEPWRGRHNERAWAARVAAILEFLFPSRTQ